MIFLLIKDLYWIILSLAMGAAVKDLGQKFTNSGTDKLNAPTVTIMGMAALSLIPAILNFFLPIGLTANVVALALSIAAGIWAKATFVQLLGQWADLIKNNKLLSALLVLLVCGLASRQTIWIDEGVYHAQYIKWIEHFPIIKGLGNVQHRFAFNSHWHVLASLMNGSFVTGQESNHINSLIYLLGSGVFLIAANKQGITKYVGIGFLLAINLPFVMCYHIIAPSADYALMILGWVLVLLAVQKWQNGRFWEMDLRAWAMLVIAAFAITVKVSAAPLAILPAVIWLRAILVDGRWKLLLVASMLCLLFWLPWVGRNYILSGSLIFPVKITALNPEWAIGEPLYNDALQFIIEGGYSLYRPDRVVVSQTDPLIVRLQKWFVHNIRFYDRAILLAALLLPLLLFAFKKRMAQFGQMGIIVASSYLGVLYWLLTAPDPRFGLGYLVPLGLLGIAPALHKFISDKKIERYLLPVTSLAVLGCWALTFVFYFYLYAQFTSDGRVAATTSPSYGVLMPYPYPTVHKEGPNGFNIADNDQSCWDAPLPCLEFEDPNIIMLGDELQDGFGYRSDATQ